MNNVFYVEESTNILILDEQFIIDRMSTLEIRTNIYIRVIHDGHCLNEDQSLMINYTKRVNLTISFFQEIFNHEKFNI